MTEYDDYDMQDQHVCACAYLGANAPCGHCESCPVCNCERCEEWHDTASGETCPDAPKLIDAAPELKRYTRADGSIVRAQPFGIGSTAQARLSDICDRYGQELRLIDGALIFYDKPVGGNMVGWKYALLNAPGEKFRCDRVDIGDYIVALPDGLGLTVMKPDRFVEYIGPRTVIDVAPGVPVLGARGRVKLEGSWEQ